MRSYSFLNLVASRRIILVYEFRSLSAIVFSSFIIRVYASRIISIAFWNFSIIQLFSIASSFAFITGSHIFFSPLCPIICLIHLKDPIHYLFA